jgi:AraC family transcriptional regulator of adaptative response/methylated-DNA-[protein]-cysteine methyltransferase
MAATERTKATVVERACRAVVHEPEARWSSARLASVAGTTPVRLQRAFRAVLGMSPRDFIITSRRRRFLDALKAQPTVTDAIYESGYGSPSRVYGGAIQLPGMTPATYARGGRGARIEWATTASQVGRILVAATPRGLCFVEIGDTDALLTAQLKHEFPEATIARGTSARLKAMASAARAAAGAGVPPADLPVDIRGTAFQWRVWRALTQIPRGQTRTYSQVARAMGVPSSVRAVANACAANPLALVVPCHRVVRRDGGLGGYRWGMRVKKMLIARERS